MVVSRLGRFGGLGRLCRLCAGTWALRLGGGMMVVALCAGVLWKWILVSRMDVINVIKGVVVNVWIFCRFLEILLTLNVKYIGPGYFLSRCSQ